MLFSFKKKFNLCVIKFIKGKYEFVEFSINVISNLLKFI